MRKLAILCAQVVVCGALAAAAHADVIYQDTFSGPANSPMNGRTPDTASNGVFGGTAGATWTATAAPVAGGNPDAIFLLSGSNTVGIVGPAGAGADANMIENNLLPFVPQAGVIYDLHAQMSPSGVGTSGNWLGLAFTQAAFNGHTPGGPSSALSNDNPYGLIILKGSGQVQSFAGLGTANAGINSAAGFIPADQFTTVDIVLDASAPQWTIKWLINGVQQGSTFTYTTNPSIGQVVFGTNKLSGSVKDFSLTTVPEPASLTLLGLGALALLRRRF